MRLIKKGSKMELLSRCKPVSSARPWTSWRRSLSGSSKSAILPPWLDWLRTTEDKEKPKSLVDVRLNRCSDSVRMFCTASSCECTKDQSILTCRASSRRRLTILHHRRLTRKPNLRSNRSMNSSIGWKTSVTSRSS